MQSLGFGARFGLGLRLFFRLLVDGALGGRIKASLEQLPEDSQPTASSAEELRSAGVQQTEQAVSADPMEISESRERGALQLLGALQREGRLVDFLMEELDVASDADIGAAARVVHAGCRKTMLNYFTVEAVWPGEDGSVVTVDEGFDPQRVQLTGNVVGQPPFQGTLQHHGWRAAQCDLPTLAASQDASIIAAAEVEL